MEERDPFGIHRYVNYDDYGYDDRNRGGYRSREYYDPWEQQEYNGYQDRGNFYQENQYQREWESDYPRSPPRPVYEEKDQSLTEMMENFIKTQIAQKEEMAIKFRIMNEQFERDRRDHEAGMQNVQRELDWAENRYESWTPDQFSYETQQDPTSQYNHYQNDQDYDQDPEYYSPPVTNEQVNEIKTGSDFEYVGMNNEWVIDEEEDEYWEVEEEEKNSVESNEGTDVVWFSATHGTSMRRSVVQVPEKFVDADFEVENEPVQVQIVPIELEIDPEQVEIFQTEVEKIFEEVECVDNAQMETLPNPLSDEIFEEKAIEEYSELDFELLGEEFGTSIEVIDMDYEDITLEEFEEMFALSTEPPSTPNEKPNRGTKRSEPEPEFEEHYNSVCSFPLFPSLSCLETGVVLQVKDDGVTDLLNAYDEPFEKRNGIFEEKNEGERSCGYSNRHNNDTISRKTRKWTDAWVKSCENLNLSNMECLCSNFVCLEKDNVVQVKEEEFAGSWNDYVDPFERRNGHFAEKVLNDEIYDYLTRHKNDTISRETREWHDAGVKNRDSVNVSNKEVLLGDHG